MRTAWEDDVLNVALEGRVDSHNVGQVGSEIMGALDKVGAQKVVIDASDLDYISSAGLRIVIRLFKRLESLSIVNVSPEVYDVFEMTGLTRMVDVRRALRTLSIDGLPMIGAGANGRVYRLDAERIVKVYNPVSNTPEKIFREKQAAREAFVRGIPSAISFEMVCVGDSYGIVYEMIDANTLGEAIKREPERLEEYATRMAEMLQKLHAIEFDSDVLPDARLNLHAWVDVAERSGYYSAEVIAAAHRLADSIPPRNTFVHGDFHPGNIMVTDDDEFLLIDMGDASVGDPLIDLIASYQIMRVVAERPGGTERYTRLSSEQSIHVWDTFVRAYYGTDDPLEIEAIEQRLRFYMILRSMAGVTFSDVVSDDMREELAGLISKALMEGMARLEQKSCS